MDNQFRVLVIDDDDPSREVMELLLRKAGFCVQSVNNGADGVALVRDGAADLVLVDLFCRIKAGSRFCGRFVSWHRRSRWW